jgi:hypothetical protein
MEQEVGLLVVAAVADDPFVDVSCRVLAPVAQICSVWSQPTPADLSGPLPPAAQATVASAIVRRTIVAAIPAVLFNPRMSGARRQPIARLSRKRSSP